MTCAEIYHEVNELIMNEILILTCRERKFSYSPKFDYIKFTFGQTKKNSNVVFVKETTGVFFWKWLKVNMMEVV